MKKFLFQVILLLTQIPNGQIWLRWNKQFETISASENDFTAFEGKTVIIGATAEGIGGTVGTT